MGYNYIRKTARYEGKRYEATGKTELEAMTKLAALLAAAKRGEHKVDGSMTVSAWYKQWFDTYKAPKGLTASSLSTYETYFRLYIKPVIGNMKLKDVTDVHLQRILNEQAGGSYSKLTKLQMVLKEMFKRARQSHLIIYNPAELLEMPSHTRGKRRSLTSTEIQILKAGAPSHPYGLLFLTMLYTGMRPGEISALKWGNIDFKENEIRVTNATEGGTANIKETKTKAGVRDIPIHEQLRPLLKEAQSLPFNFVFPTEHGGLLQAHAINKRFKKFAKDVGLTATDITPYNLRHTFCTNLQKAGVPLNVAKTLMGHANIAITANIYTHSDKDTLHQNMQKLSAFTY